MNRILILFAHPALEKSRVQRRLLKAAEAIEDITIHDLYETYPDFMIDVPAEQSLLLEHDLILFQHPLYWYSCPSLLKEWQDLVLEYGFAYGREGDALKGKTLGSIISSGGSRMSYSNEGRNHYSMKQLLQPFDQTARLCGMDYLPPFAVHRTHDMHESVIDEHSEHYRQILWRLQRGLPSKEETNSLEYLNDWAAE
ncbi:NAD(P)H-dependent oxidoreductase [Leucothrix arctica]|uniref:NAD(P)H oxidoreductase n=1 Tax=Leucothrix arctica TaxID=1481894 RepID=A0A317C934_9GAMM|nr:NAD(P)H-dependent oxidoreductase [Leucothrix arctica]PWQ94847.1 NAD(P)H oxidoreductase [Leucothrix arctica]